MHQLPGILQMVASCIQYVMEGLLGVTAGTLIIMSIWERCISTKVIFKILTYLPMMNVSFVIKLVETCGNILWIWWVWLKSGFMYR
jgi:hypothetical protein